MRDNSHEGFDGAAAIFAEHAKTLRGYIRYQVTQHNLEPFVSDSKQLHCLDIGGGSGIDAAWLSSHGHAVTMIEPSDQQHKYAERRINYFLPQEQRQRITLLKGSLGDISPRKKFNLVLMHGVAMYQQDPVRFIEAALKYVKPDGQISILEKGYYGAENRALHEQKFKAQKSLKESQRIVNNLGLSTYAFKPEEIEAALVNNQFEIIRWSGVRVIADDNHMLVKDFEEKELQSILSAEIEQGSDPRIRAQGQMLHFIARRTTV